MVATRRLWSVEVPVRSRHSGGGLHREGRVGGENVVYAAGWNLGSTFSQVGTRGVEAPGGSGGPGGMW
jgi:hypothetical protein